MAARKLEDDRPRTSGIGVLLRTFWMLIGPGVMALSGLHILFFSPARFALADAIFLGVGAALPLARYIDITRFGGTTAEGGPVTLQSWRRYALGVGVCTVVGWVAANGVGLMLAG